MGKTAQLVMKIVGGSLALASLICLLIGFWSDLVVCAEGAKRRGKREADEEL